MSLLQKAENRQAFDKIGVLGFAGSGKTFTSMSLALGILDCLKSKAPIAFMDTESGSDFFIDMCHQRGIELMVVKSRAFSDVFPIFAEAETMGCGVLVIDSVSHLWKEITDTYKKRLNRRKLQFQDWDAVKTEWSRFTDLFLNAPIHTIICGRAGYEYDYFENEDGKKELHKTGTKMKAEGEFGYEPSLVIEMQRIKRSDDKHPDLKGWTHRATVLKDRTDTINGMEFDFNTEDVRASGGRAVFDAFAPHFAKLAIGGDQLGIDITRTSAELFTPDGELKGEAYRKQKQILLEEIFGVLDKEWPGTTKEAKDTKNNVFEFMARVAGCKNLHSKTEFEGRSVHDLRDAHVELIKHINETRTKGGCPLLDVPLYEVRETTLEPEATP